MGRAELVPETPKSKIRTDEEREGGIGADQVQNKPRSPGCGGQAEEAKSRRGEEASGPGNNSARHKSQVKDGRGQNSPAA